MDESVAAVISAAGRGTRMGWDRNKLMMELEGTTILERTLQVMKQSGRIDRYVVVVRNEDHDEVRDRILPRVFGREAGEVILVEGGESREESTRNGLDAVPGECGVVLTHDGARPFAECEIVGRVLDRLAEGDVEGVICAVPVKDTIKVASRGLVEMTPVRSTLFAVQTPQAFRVDVLRRAYEKAMRERVAVTDDSQIVEIFGGKIAVVEGSYRNIKITTAEDLLMGELLLRKSGKESE